MILTNYKTEDKNNNPHGVEVKKMYDDQSVQIMHMTLQSGQGLKPHITPIDVTFYIFEGKVTFLVGEETEQFEGGMLFESPAHLVHNLKNETEKVARVLVIKAPRPATPVKYSIT